MQLNLTAVGGGAARDVVVDAEPTTTVAEFAHALAMAPGDVFDGPPETELAETGLRVGTVLPRSAAPDPVPGTVRLEVVGGPFAGETIPLPRRTVVAIGSEPRMLVRLLDPAVAAHHLDVEVVESDVPGGGPSLRVAPVAGIVVDGEETAEEVVVGTASLLQVGSSMLRLGVVPAPNADTAAEGVAHVGFNRGARIRPAFPTPMVKLPGERPKKAQQRALPWLSALVPVVLGVGMATLLHSPRFLMVAVFSPVMVIGNYAMGRRTAKKAGAESVETWRTQVLDAREEIAQLRRTQRERAWRQFPDPVTLTDIASTPLARLWERRIDDPDATLVRVGLGDVDLDVALEGTRIRSEGVPVGVGVSPSPITVDLAAGVVGVAGPRPVTAAVGRAMLCQLAVGRSPRDLRIVVLCEDGAETDWSWTRWLPHVAGEGSCTIGNTDETRRDRIRELTAVIESRRAANGRAPVETQYVVLVDQARTLRMLPGMLTVLEEGPAAGVLVVALDEDWSRLPQESATELVVDGASLTTGRVTSRTAAHETVLLDAVAPWQAERIARALAPLVHVTGAGDQSLLPRAVRFVDLVELDLDDPAALARRWALEPRATRVPVGAGLHGPFTLDLATDGPHALVAGTTGAGKSEFLQTLVVSLALANRPDALNFVLVDYKGGAAFADCERLPHTVGMVTNLDGRGTERALESLDAELRRRETVLREMGAKDADTAWEKDPATASARGMARLVLVIDEFAELKSELPTFIDGLIRIARVGRSLGVHLVLATQRPAGSITPEMQSNTNLRVALRVTDKADSSDVLGSPEAASIARTTPGRGYARQGVGVAPVEFQTARIAGRRPGVVHQTRSEPRVAGRDWWRLGVPVEFPPAPAAGGPVDHDDTDLRAAVDLVREASQQLGVRLNPSPWLEPLPEALGVDEVAAPASGGAVVLGLEDVPARQAQVPALWNPLTQSHLAVIGGARSGRTSTLRTIAAQLALTHAPRDLHLYAIDYGGGGLLPLAGLPHCGAVVVPSEIGRADRLWERLFDEIGRRQELMARHGVGSLAELRGRLPQDERPPHAVLLIDGWDKLLGDAGDAMLYRKAVGKFLREAPAAGIRVVVAGDKGLGLDSILGFVPDRLVLPLTGRPDYHSIAGVPERSLPERIPPGRVYMGKPVREIQLALLPGDPSGEGQHRTLTNVVASIRARPLPPLPEALRPVRVDVLPRSISLARARALPVVDGCPVDGVTVAVGGDELSRYTIALGSGQHFLVTGERRSGRSSALAAILAQAVTSCPAAFAVAPRPSPLRQVAKHLGVPVLSESDLDMEAPEFGAFAAPLSARATAAGQEAVLVVCDDADQLQGSRLERFLLSNVDALSIVAATSSQAAVARGLDGEAKKDGHGIILSPRKHLDGTMSFGIALPNSLVGMRQAGSGVLLREGNYVGVQVPYGG